MNKLLFIISFILTILLIICCNSAHLQKNSYQINSYLDIPVDSMGKLTKNPYVLKFKNKNKELFVIGTEHSRDTLNPMFSAIERIFTEFRPNIIINEGGDLTKKYTNRNQAIMESGELGLEKFLADNAGIKTLNGDLNDKLEFETLSKAFTKKEALVFFASERFIFPFAFGQYKGNLEKVYDSIFIKKYMLKEHIYLSIDERSFGFYIKAYKKYFHHEFSLDSINQLDFTPFSRKHHFNDVTRKSKEIRDIALLNKIEEEMNQHDKVLVIFGGWHVLSIEPALGQIMTRLK